MTPADVLLCDNVIPIIMRTFEAAGIQVDRDRVPYLKGVVGSAAVSGAGLRINGRAEASLPGLYGAGNTTDGAYVVMAQNLSTCAVMGHWAGNAVPDYVAQAPAPRPHADQVARLHAEIVAPRGRPPGPTYAEAHDRLERLLLDLGHVLTEQELATGMAELADFQERVLPLLPAADPHALAKVHGLRSFCDALGVALPVMRHRTESRGNVLRADYPYTDNEQWLKWTVAWRTADGLRLRDVPVPDSADYDLPPRQRVPHPFFAPVGV
jgi:succinate dehydrogenase/fumarate reductase flavoprotein subunit